MKYLDTLPKLDSVDGRIVMQDLYETQYGIYNHIAKDPTRPLASVAFHDVEDINEGSMLEEAIRTYANRQIGEYTRLSLVEFLELPSDIVAMVIKICDEIAKKKEKTLQDVERDLGLGKT